MIATSAALAGLVLAVPASAARTPVCQEVAFSPAFSRDHTMWCSESVADDGAYVYRSTDAGRSWGRGVQVKSGDGPQFMARVVVSPLYAADRRVLVWTTEPNALFESLDGGMTFSPEPVAEPQSEVAPYVETLGTGKPRAAFVHGVGGNGTYDSELGRRSVVGVPGHEVLRYIVPASFAQTRKAVAVAVPAAMAAQSGTAVTPDTTVAVRCEADFVCVQTGYDFGHVFVEGVDELGRRDQHYVIAREFTRHADGTTAFGRARAWRSNDAGGAWTGWASVERLLNSRPSTTKWTITGSPDSHRLFLLGATVTHGPNDRTITDDTYTMAFWRSDDDGATWNRLSVPWTRPVGLHPVTVTAQAGNRVYATGSRSGFTGLFCSLDNGRSWRAGTCR